MMGTSARVLGSALCLLWALAGREALAADQGGAQPAPYLQLGLGGAENALGGAAAGLRGNISGAFWNPAGATGIKGTQFELEHTVLSLGRELEYFAVASNYREAYYVGFSALIYSDGNDLEARSGPTLAPDSVFSDTDLTFYLTVAYRLDPNWDMGFNLKILTQTYSLGGLTTGLGVGEDVGFQFKPDNQNVIGLTLKDPFSDLIYSDQTDKVFPPTLTLGWARKWPDPRLKGDLDLAWNTGTGLTPHLGLEWMPLPALALRGGYWLHLDSGEDGFGAGAGLFIPGPGCLTEFDYTLIPDRVDGGDLLQQMTLSFKFL